MSQIASLGDCWFVLCQCLVWKAETEEVDPQERLRVYVRVSCGVMDKRAVGDPIIKRKHCFKCAIGMPRTCLSTSGFDRRINDPPPAFSTRR